MFVNPIVFGTAPSNLVPFQRNSAVRNSPTSKFVPFYFLIRKLIPRGKLRFPYMPSPLCSNLGSQALRSRATGVMLKSIKLLRFVDHHFPDLTRTSSILCTSKGRKAVCEYPPSPPRGAADPSVHRYLPLSELFRPWHISTSSIPAMIIPQIIFRAAFCPCACVLRIPLS